VHIKSLKVFCDVVTRRSFSRAAHENGITQSNASQVVNHLEQRLGVRLLDRSTRPFALTPEGEKYYRGCRELVEQYFALEEEVRTLPAEVAGKVRVAAIYSAGLSYMNRYVHAFRETHPRADVQLQYQHPDQIYELVETGQVDFGVVSYPHTTRTIAVLPWRNEPMVMVCAPGHPLAKRKTITLEDLRGVTMVSFDRKLPIRRAIDRALAAHKVSIRVALELDNTEAMKRAIEMDANVGLLPQPTVAREVASGFLVAVALEGDSMITRPLGIIRRRGKPLGKTAQRFLGLLQEPPDADSAGAGSGESSYEYVALGKRDEH